MRAVRINQAWPMSPEERLRAGVPMKRLFIFAALAGVAGGSILVSLSRAARNPESAVVTANNPSKPIAPTGRIDGAKRGGKPPSIQQGQTISLRDSLTPTEEKAAATYTSFVAAAQLSADQEAALRRAFWDAKRNRMLAKEESSRAFHEV